MTDIDIKELTISPSGISAFEKSPSAFIRYKEGEKEYSKAMNFGTAFHCYLLRQRDFVNEYIISDIPPMDGMMGEFIRTFFDLFSEAEDNNFEGWNKEKAYDIAYAASGFKTKKETVIKNFENEEGDEKKAVNMKYFDILRENKGKFILTSQEYELILEMKAKIFDHKVASKLFIDDHSRNCEYLNEFDYEWDYKGGIVRMHGIFDRVIIDHDAKAIILVDLKTSQYASKASFEVSAAKYRYDRQMAVYRSGLFNYLYEKDMENYEIFSYIVVSQKAKGNDCAVYSISREDLRVATKSYTDLVEDMIWHIDEDKWDYPREYYEGEGIIELCLNEKKG
jgi:hypothetical protein